MRNVAPTAVLVVPATAVRGLPVTARLDAADDPSAAGRAGLRFSFDWNGDGRFEVVDSPTPAATCPRTGPHTARGRVADKDGGVTEYSATLVVLPPAPVVTAVSDDTGTAGDGVTRDWTLIVRGTAEPRAVVTVSRDGVRSSRCGPTPSAGGRTTVGLSPLSMACTSSRPRSPTAQG